MNLREVPNESAQWSVEKLKFRLSKIEIAEFNLDNAARFSCKDDAVCLGKMQSFLILILNPLTREELSRGRNVPAQLAQNLALEGPAARLSAAAPLRAARQSGHLA